MDRRTKRICIVGGGPAGLATAIAAAQVGIEATVQDCATPPIDKACGEGLLPDSLAALAELGISVPPSVGFRFRGIQFSDGNLSITGRFRSGSALGLRRTVLHNLLVRRATSLGVQFRWGYRDQPGTEFDFIVGADGGQSAIRRLSGLDRDSRESHRFGFRRHFWLPPWSDCVQVHWSRRCQVYVTPVSPDSVGVAVVSSDPKLRLEDALPDFPQLFRRLQGAKPVSSERGCLSTMRTLQSVCTDRFALVGDASGSVDVITGEGLGLGFRQALALANALHSGELERYAKAHRQLSQRPRLMAKVLLALGSSNRLRVPAFAGLRLCPGLFSSLLAFHVGS